LILKFSTAGELEGMRRQQLADVILVRSAYDVWNEEIKDLPPHEKLRSRFFEDRLTSARLKSIKGQFASNLTEAGLPSNIYSEDETERLISALWWMLNADLPLSYAASGVPLLTSYSEKLINSDASDKLKARIRMVLALMGNVVSSKPVALEDYAGYLSDEWWSPV